MKRILLVFLSVFAFISVHADITWSLSEDGTLTISGNDMPDYVLRSPWDSQKGQIKKIQLNDGVKNIGNHAFYQCYNLTSIAIPNSVTSIGEHAFYDCTSLTSITIPNSVASIGNYAFYGCSGLTSITIPNSITKIEDSTFSGCSGLTSITIPNSVTSIGNYAFYSCYRLTSISIPNSVISIGNYAFRDCNNITTIAVPNSVSTIGEGAFYKCLKLKSFSIPNSVTNIEEYTFSWCSELTSISIPNSVTNIGNHAFYDCSGLTSITIPNSVTSIGDNAFYKCTGLKSITIQNGVTSIGKSAFRECSGLKSITIPNSVTSIGEHAICYCPGLISVSIEKGNVKYDSRNNCDAIIETATNTLIAGCKNTIIPNSVTSIGNYAFIGCSSLTSITIPNSVTSIGNHAFRECSELISITIPNSVTSIGNYAFYGCKGLASINIPNSVTSIGNYAFYGCKGLASINIPNSVTSIGDYAFYDCYSLTSVTNLSTTPQRISPSTFSKYGNLHILPGCKEAYQKAYYWKNFTIVEDAVEPSVPIELADGMTYNEVTTQENKEISYTRTFNNTSWQSLYIPFSMTFDDWKDDFEVAYINGIRQMDTDDDGAIDETIMDVVKIKSGSLIPNTPYLIKAKTTGNKTITVNDATLYKAESNSVDCSTTIAKYTFTGTYSTIPAATLLANNYYAMGGGSLIMTDGTSDLKPFRWYLNVESRSPMYNVSSGAKAITINVVGEEETTGISQISSDRENSSAIYDLNGRKMSQKTLKSGLYIKNGKKVFIK